jgi:hypothetical protein
LRRAYTFILHGNKTILGKGKKAMKMSVIKPGTYTTLLSVIAVGVLTYVILTLAERGRAFYIRPQRSIQSLDEELEYTTKVGGVVNFGVGDYATLSGTLAAATNAGFEVLKYVGKYCARTNTKLVCNVMGRGGAGGDIVAMENEILRDAYAEEGHPEAYSPQMIRYLGGDREAYETAIYDFYVKEKVTTNIYMGAWSGGMMQPTIMANAYGIRQVTGTTDSFQYPEQVAITDYFAIAEEVYATSALVGGDASICATLKISDFFKFALLAILIVGNIVYWTMGSTIARTILGY